MTTPTPPEPDAAEHENAAVKVTDEMTDARTAAVDERPLDVNDEDGTQDEDAGLIAEVEPDPDHAWKALSNVNDWIKHAESKTAIVFGAAAASGVMLYNLVKNQSDPGAVVSVFAVLTGVAMVIAGLAGAVAILPRLTLNPKKLPALNKALRVEPDLSSLLFFTHIAKKYKRDSPTYVEVFRTLTSDDDQLTRQIAHQVHANATVAHRKYRFANIAIVALALDYAFLAIVAAIVGSR